MLKKPKNLRSAGSLCQEIWTLVTQNGLDDIGSRGKPSSRAEIYGRVEADPNRAHLLVRLWRDSP